MVGTRLDTNKYGYFSTLKAGYPFADNRKIYYETGEF